MKIKTPKDIEKLDLKIKEELGVDVQKYRNEEVIENFVDLLIFPKYAVSWVIRPILISIVLYILGFSFLHLVHIEYVLYAIIGLVLFLAIGLLAGIIYLIWKMKSDICGIVDYSLDILKSAVVDIKQVNTTATKENRKDVLGLLFKGIIHIVTIPMLAKVISDKVPIIGRLLTSVINKILTLVANQVNFKEQTIAKMTEGEGGQSGAIQMYANSISIVSGGLKKVVGFAFGVAQLPLKIAISILLLIHLLFLYILN